MSVNIITNGAMVFTGNTLGLSGPRNDGLIIGSIGAFTTLDLSQQVPGGYPLGTTITWQANESQAQLTIPPGSTVLHAELQWGGSEIAAGAGNVTPFVDVPVTFTTPLGSNTVLPNPANSAVFAFDAGSGINQFYTRSQDVTALVQAAGSGTYSVGGVPSLVTPDANAITNAGWTLGVIYGDPALPTRNMTIYTQFSGIRSSTIDIPINGFRAPSVGPVNGRILLSAMEGDPGISGDNALFGPNAANLVTLSGPNNLINNFFASQINDGNSESPTVGQLDTTGTFGNLNSTPGSNPPLGVRQGWDITNVTAPNISVNQTSAVLRLTSAGDAYAVPLVGVQLDTVIPTSFVCEPYGYRVSVPVGSTNSSLTKINLLTGLTTIVNSDVGANVNAIGYNTLDNLIYGMTSNTNNLILLDKDGLLFDYGAVPNLPVANYDVGAIDNNGHLFIRNSISQTYYVIDVNQNSPNFGNLLDPTNGFILDTSPYGTSLSTNINSTDWAFNSADGQLYAYNSTTSSIVRINPLTGAVTTLTTTGLPASTYGPVYTINDGYLYVTNNTTGTIYRVDIVGNTATAVAFSQDVITVQNDGASCLDANLDIDFGDAPNTNPLTQGTNNYRTLLASNGPRHGIVDSLTLGPQITAEDDGYQSPTALGDDQILGIQDDGTNLPLTNMALYKSTYSIVETVFNNTGQSANVYAWIDFNKDGVFQTNEGTTATVLSSSIPQALSLTFTVPSTTVLTPGDTFVRVRTTTDTLVNTGSLTTEDTRSFGAASDGEVEDYLLTIENTMIISTKRVSNQYADLGDTITYSITLYNPGTLSIPNVVFQDTLPSGTSYANSLTVSSPYSGSDPMSGLIITYINAGQTVNISWLVRIGDTLPSPNPITNTGNIFIPGLPSTITNVVTTQVNSANLVVNKSANRQVVSVGETITYTITITNTGNTMANPAIVTDIIPAQTTYVTGTLTVDGISNASDPNIGIDISPVLAGQSKVLVYELLVSQNPTSLPINNTASVDYKYTVDPSFPPISKEVISNLVSVDVASVSIVKTVDKAYAQVGDILTYTNVITNTGNATITNIIFTDTTPTYTTYRNATTRINGVLYPSLDPNIPISLATQVPFLFPLSPGMSITESHQVIVDTIPQGSTILNTSSGQYEYIDNTTSKTGNKTSNEVKTIVNEGELEVVKSVDKTIVALGDTLTYTLVVKNTGNIEVQDVILVDTIPPQTKFVDGSVTVGGLSRPTDNIITGVSLGTILSQTSVTVTFKVIVTTLPIYGNIENTASVNYKVVVDPNSPPITENRNSNKVITKVENVEIVLVKQCTPDTVSVGSNIDYTFVIINTGTVTVSNIKFFDTLPNSVEFVEGSFTGANQTTVVAKDLLTGVDIGTLIPTAQRVVSFKGKLTTINCLYSIYNTSFITYDYELIQNNTVSKTSSSNQCGVDIESIDFKQSYKDGNLIIPTEKPDIESLLNVDVVANVISTELINSPSGTSIEGQILTGKKLLLCIKFNVTVEYVALVTTQEVHTASYEISSCEYVVVPKDTDLSCCSNAIIDIEDVYYEKINNRELFYNITYLVNSLC